MLVEVETQWTIWWGLIENSLLGMFNFHILKRKSIKRYYFCLIMFISILSLIERITFSRIVKLNLKFLLRELLTFTTDTCKKKTS